MEDKMQKPLLIQLIVAKYCDNNNFERLIYN